MEEMRMGQCLVDPNTGELDSEHSYLNSKRKVTTGSKWKQIHVKWDDCTGLEHGSKLHVEGTSTLPHPPISSAKPPPPAAQVGTLTAHAVGGRSIGASTAAAKGRM